MANNLLKKNDLLGKKQKKEEEKLKKEKVDKKIVIPVLGVSVLIIALGIFLILHFSKDNKENKVENIPDGEVTIQDETVNNNITTVELSDTIKSTIKVNIETDDEKFLSDIVVECQKRDDKIIEFITGNKNGVDFRYKYISDDAATSWYTFNNNKYELYEGDVIQNSVDVEAILNNIFMYCTEDNLISNQLITEILPDSNIYYTYSVPYKLEQTANGYKLSVTANNVKASSIGDTEGTININKIDIVIDIENIADLSNESTD